MVHGADAAAAAEKSINEREHFANCTNAPSFSLYISTIEIETDLKLLTDYASETTNYEETEKFLCGFVIIYDSSAELCAPPSVYQPEKKEEKHYAVHQFG